ncbi:RNA polymerase I-specific transcription initiation factor RRN3 [Pholiota conissans]|uniref:RNA polymerase I-specific transcription initiation factor RRN3 n=1 Tax=Pholiota conissans TaxID=109636 RepID=A0A9P5Z5P0_9AGAR|nr:RNA polymerase I-specific transcription initiation factor RRN3 [Pholiota conissans]
MDPHSTRSQFNHRTPKAGPILRTMDSVSSQKSEPSKLPPKSSAKASKAASTNLLVRRPIATNSRVKQDEMVKRDMYLSFVTNALQQKANGISDTFDELVSQFNGFTSSQQQPQQVDTAQIRLWLLALSHVVSRLERTHAALVDAIVNMPWTTIDSATVKSYTVFIGMLLSARPEYLSLVLSKIAQGFTYQSGILALDTNLPSTSSAPITRRIIYDRLHYLLRHILALVPTLPSTLQPLLVRHFPHKRQNQVAQTTYIRNLLRVSSYCPELADKILATIVDRAIQIDVEIQIELEELEEQDSVDEQDIFELDPFDTVLGQEPNLDSDDDSGSDDDSFSDLSSEAEDLDERPIEVPTNTQHIQEMVKKLDAILFLLFEHFDKMKNLNSKSINSRPMSPMELPPLPPLENSFLEFGPPYTQSADIRNSDLLPTISASTSARTSPSKDSHKLTDKSPLRSQFHSLLSIFDRTILRTFKSRYTQFLVFWYASLDPEFADVFQGMLVDRALMSSSIGGPASLLSNPPDGEASAVNVNAHMMTPELTRAVAASYIGSFVSRATFVDREGARRVVGVLCEYLRSHLDNVEEDLRTGLGFRDASTYNTSNNRVAAATISAILASGQHTVFYAVAQAVFLVFCFRWRDLVGGDEDENDLDLDLDASPSKAMPKGRDMNNGPKDKWMPELAVLKRVVVSVLNPLKVCSPNVVMQFARVAQATDFVYCYTILETNKRTDMSFSSSTASRPSNSNISRPESLSSLLSALQTKILYEPANVELTTFFPFDPYRLPKSSVYIQDVYREWSSVAIDDDEDSDEDSDDEGTRLRVSDDGDLSEVDVRRSAHLDIPTIGVGKKNEDDGGLGESLGAMSISPARMSISVGMRL